MTFPDKDECSTIRHVARSGGPQGTGCGKRVRCSRHLLPRGFRDVQYMPIVEAFGPERGSLSLDGLQLRVRGKKPPIAQIE